MEFRYFYRFSLKNRYKLLKDLGLRSLLYPSEKSDDYILRRLWLSFFTLDVDLLSKSSVKVSYDSTKAGYYVDSYACPATDALMIIFSVASSVYYD